jgi:hypothetical protein
MYNKFLVLVCRLFIAMVKERLERDIAKYTQKTQSSGVENLHRLTEIYKYVFSGI